MAINEWWASNPDQRCWMEVATTGHMGEILIAPKFPGAHWSYELVGLVHAGDTVLHWQSDPAARGFVGWSVATNDPEVVPEYTWQPRGTSGRALPARTTEGWMVTLGGLNHFQQPPTPDQIQALMGRVMEVNETLENEHRKPTYFPFYMYGGRELRAQQGYLLKFPVELFGVVPNIGDASARVDDGTEEALTEDNERQRRTVPRGRVTRVQDPILRSAIEMHAVDVAIDYFRDLGGSEFLKLGKPYDVRFMLNGVERHVEVKGSSLVIETVELTVNEVDHANGYQPTDLVVVDGIEWTRTGDTVTTAGGRLRVWSDWTPGEDDLSPRKFAYSLPSL
jgi:hypothetical protein